MTHYDNCTPQGKLVEIRDRYRNGQVAALDFESLIQAASRALRPVVARYRAHNAHLWAHMTTEDIVRDMCGDNWHNIERRAASCPHNGKADDFPAFLGVILRNWMIDKMRSAGRHPALSLDEEHAGTGRSIQDQLARNDAPELIDSGLAHRVRRLPAGFKTQYLEPLVEHYVNEKTYEQLADQYGVKLGTMKSRLHKAKKMLGESLGSDVEFTGSEIATVLRDEGLIKEFCYGASALDRVKKSRARQINEKPSR